MPPRKQKSSQKLPPDFDEFSDVDMAEEDDAMLAEFLKKQEQAKAAAKAAAEVNARIEANKKRRREAAECKRREEEEKKREEERRLQEEEERRNRETETVRQQSSSTIFVEIPRPGEYYHCFSLILA
jgi:hypothetical protein